MFPFRDHNPTRRQPLMTWGLIAVNIVVHLYALTLSLPAQNSFIDSFAATASEVSTGQRYTGLLTYMFLHAGWMHLGGNMLFLWIFGDNLEDQLGRLRFLAFYLAGGIAAALVQICAAPYSDIPLVGASGAIAAVMGGYLLLFPKARVDILFIIVIIFKIFPLPAWIVLSIWFALQAIGGWTADGSMVAYWAHAGGFITGLLMIAPFWHAHGGTAFWQRTHGHPPYPETRYRRSPLPRIRR